MRAGALDPPLAAVLVALLDARIAFLISGGAGTGKTTLLGALLGHVPARERVVVVEDATELTAEHPHLVRLEARPANVEGAGEISLRELVRQALRMRPDRLIVGEVRGPELLDLLLAANTGHDGGLTTLHANGVADVPARVEALAMLAGVTRPAAHALLAAAFRVAVQLRRGRDGRRHVAEVALLEGRRLRARPHPAGPDVGRRRVTAAARPGGPRLGPRAGRPWCGTAGRVGRAAVSGAVSALGLACAAGAGWLLVPEGRGGSVRATWQRLPARWSRVTPGHRRTAVLGVGAAAGAGMLAAGLLVPALVGIGVAVVAGRRWRAARARRAAVAAREAEVRLLRALASELRAGLSPGEALRAVADDGEPAGGLAAQLAAAAATDGLGGDPVPVLAAASGSGPALAATWSVSRRTGAPLAEPVRRIAEAAAAELRLGREVEAALASARSSAQLLALLPLAGAALGALSGAGTVRVLLTSGPGQACLLIGVLLDLAGLTWLDRLAARAGR